MLRLARGANGSARGPEATHSGEESRLTAHDLPHLVGVERVTLEVIHQPEQRLPWRHKHHKGETVLPARVSRYIFYQPTLEVLERVLAENQNLEVRILEVLR